MKHKLKARHYIRYADDFVILDVSRADLDQTLAQIDEFLALKLGLNLHPDKVFISTFASGIDFLGWVHFPDHRVLRTNTKRRMFARLRGSENEASRESYLGLLRHGNAHTLQELIGGVQ